MHENTRYRHDIEAIMLTRQLRQRNADGPADDAWGCLLAALVVVAAVWLLLAASN